MYWLVARRHQTIIQTDADKTTVQSFGIRLKAISLEIVKVSIPDISLKITYSKLQPHLPGSSELEKKNIGAYALFSITVRHIWCKCSFILISFHEVISLIKTSVFSCYAQKFLATSLTEYGWEQNDIFREFQCWQSWIKMGNWFCCIPVIHQSSPSIWKWLGNWNWCCGGGMFSIYDFGGSPCL